MFRLEICFEKDRKQCGKRRKCWLPAFSPFPTSFQKASFSRSFKVGIVWERLLKKTYKYFSLKKRMTCVAVKIVCFEKSVAELRFEPVILSCKPLLYPLSFKPAVDNVIEQFTNLCYLCRYQHQNSGIKVVWSEMKQKLGL